MSQSEYTATSVAPARTRETDCPELARGDLQQIRVCPFVTAEEAAIGKDDARNPTRMRAFVLTMVFRKTYSTGMLGGCTEKHLATLRQRYGEKRLCEAAIRREHLNYQRIHVGDGPGSGRVKFLLAQMHQTYYFGFSESACILAGTVLEQALIYRLGGCMARKGPLPFTRGGDKTMAADKSGSPGAGAGRHAGPGQGRGNHHRGQDSPPGP